MNDFGSNGKLRSAFLGLKRRRESEQAPKWSVFGAVFTSFGTVFTKSDSFFAKIGYFFAIFGDFGKEGCEIAPLFLGEKSR